MKTTNEDRILRQLFRKIGMEKVPEGFTSRVMDRIMVNPEIEPARKFYFEWWWIAVGVLTVLSVYFSEVYYHIYNLLAPYFIQIFSPFVKYFSGLYDLIPSNVVILPSSVVLPSIITGVIFILFADLIFGNRSVRIFNH